MLDWVMSLLDDSPVVQVFGAASGAEELATTHPSPRSTIAQFVFANELHCLFNVGVTAPQVRLPYEALERWTHCRVAIYCERGRVLFEEFGRWEIGSPDGVESGQTASMQEWQAHNDRAQANLTEAMLTWIEDDSRPAGTHLARSLSQWNTLLGVYASAVWGRPVPLPFDPPDDLFELLTARLRGEEQCKPST